MSAQLSFPFEPDCSHSQRVSEIPNKRQASLGFLDAITVARQYFPDTSKEELEFIIQSETGWPSFWHIPRDGATPEECFRTQLLNAVARRHVRYSNMKIIEADPYAGVVDRIELKPDGFGRCTIELPDHTEIYVDRDGISEVRFADDAKIISFGSLMFERDNGSGGYRSVALPNGRQININPEGDYQIEDYAYLTDKTDHPRITKVDQLRIKDGRSCIIALPDGSQIHVGNNGNYQIDDRNAEVIYRANRIRDFNRFLNASEIMEEFVRYVGTLGVKQGDVLNLPISLFINFLVVRAADADGEPTPDVAIEKHPALTSKCPQCGR